MNKQDFQLAVLQKLAGQGGEIESTELREWVNAEHGESITRAAFYQMMDELAKAEAVTVRRDTETVGKEEVRAIYYASGPSRGMRVQEIQDATRRINHGSEGLGGVSPA